MQMNCYHLDKNIDKMEQQTFLNPYKLTAEHLQITTEKNQSCDEIENITSEKDTNKALDSPSNNCVSHKILQIQSFIYQFQTQYGKYIRGTIYSILIAAYFVYFGYAMYYQFGDEPSIRLLWITCSVIAVKIVLTFNLWTKLCNYCDPVIKRVPENRWPLISCIVGLAVLLGTVTFVVVDVTILSQNVYNLVSFTGIVLYIAVVFLFSTEPAKVKWLTVLWGMNLQFLCALCVLRWHVGYTVIKWVATRFNTFLFYADNGSRFVFGESYIQHWFAFKAMPVVVFVSSIISVLYHLGVMQRVIRVIGLVLQKVMGTTAAESVAAAGNIFVGNTEAPLMILPMIKYMTRSELHCLMVGGFATISGSAFATFVILGAPPNHLIAASVMSAPAALALAKLSYPETEQSKTTVQDIHSLQISEVSNTSKVFSKRKKVTSFPIYQLICSKCKSVVEAAATGAIQSIRLVANMTVNILAFLGILMLINETMAWMGHRVGIKDPDLNFGLLCSYLLFPVALTMGVELNQCRKVAEILGIKAFINTAMAYKMLGDYRKNKELFYDHITTNGTYDYVGDNIMLYHENGSSSTLTNGFLSDRTEAITTFSLCGFASIDSIGIVIGALSALVPERKSDLAELVLRAMIIGNITSFLTACVAGLLYQGN